MITIRVRGKSGNIVLRNYWGTITMEVDGPILTVDSMRVPKDMAGEIHTVDCIYLDDIVSIKGNYADHVR